MNPEALQAAGWTFCAIGYALHVARRMPLGPLIVRRPVLPPQPLTVVLAREGGDGIRATGELELEGGLEREVVAAELERLAGEVRRRTDEQTPRTPGFNGLHMMSRP